ncbi:unnamed protein product [Gongylonema pulchrum]|uniref:GLOBIN domain-containing protein n=1 Tax=Gongylonema pulchrum TaxID=637853 RepID=A0A183EF71_9BILA|nr:unnamed protein product [Gongylonema pulchrum]
MGPKVSILKNSTRAAITDCWRTVLENYDNDYSKVGVNIYAVLFSFVIRIFEICPELRQVFHIPREAQDIRHHEPFHRSGKLLASVIDLCIRNIYKLEAEMEAVLVSSRLFFAAIVFLHAWQLLLL